MHILRHYILHLSHTVQLSLSESEYSRFIIVKLAHGVIYLMIRVSVLPPYLIRSVCLVSGVCKEQFSPVLSKPLPSSL